MNAGAILLFAGQALLKIERCRYAPLTLPTACLPVGRAGRLRPTQPFLFYFLAASGEWAFSPLFCLCFLSDFLLKVL